MVSRTSGSDVTQLRLLRRVVLATDFSSRASQAVRRVQYLPFALGAEVVLAHVLPPKDSRRRKVESLSRSRLDRQADRLRRGLERLGCPHVSVRAVLVSGTPAVEIAKIALESSADLLVVGRHGTGTLKDLLLGSTAERLIHDSQVPVLIVSPQPLGSYRTPLIALPHSTPARFFSTPPCASCRERCGRWTSPRRFLSRSRDGCGRDGPRPRRFFACGRSCANAHARRWSRPSRPTEGKGLDSACCCETVTHGG